MVGRPQTLSLLPWLFSLCRDFVGALPSHYRAADGALLVFDIANESLAQSSSIVPGFILFEGTAAREGTARYCTVGFLAQLEIVMVSPAGDPSRIWTSGFQN